MRQLEQTGWQRKGISWLWDADARNQVCASPEIWSLRDFLAAAPSRAWPDKLPSNGGNALVVAGLDACLNLFDPVEAELWLKNEYKPALKNFQNHFNGELALLFWLPVGGSRLVVKQPSDDVVWICQKPTMAEVAFGRILWGNTGNNPQEILQGGVRAGLYHKQLS